MSATSSARPRAPAPPRPSARAVARPRRARTPRRRGRRVVGRHGDGCVRREHFPVARDVGRDDGQRAREGARRTIPKLSRPIEGAMSAFERSNVAVSSSWLRNPTTSSPSSETRSRVSRRRTASGSAPATVRRSPVRAWISGQARRSTCRPLRGSCLPAKTTRCSRSPALGLGRTRTPFGITS